MFACAFNLLLCYSKELGFLPELAIPVAVAASFALSVVTGLIVICRLGIYFTMSTLALSQLVFLIYPLAPFTRCEDGILGVPQGKLFGLLDLSDTITLYYVVLFVFLAGFLIVYRAVNSPFGEVLRPA